MSDLMRSLVGAGEVEDQGGFSIDADKAREKLRQYQLADPHNYVLLLVEAAVLAGAESLAFEVDSDDVHLRFVAPPFGYARLENIYGALFVEASALDEGELEALRAAQQLAFGLNSAMALNPRWVRVRSVGPGGEGAQLELRPDEDDVLEALSGEAPGTHIHVRDRFRPGLLVEFFRHLRGNIAEATILAESCRWSRTPITLNGELITHPDRFADDYEDGEDVVVDEAVIGQAFLGLDEGRAPPQVHLLANGVSVGVEDLDRGVEGFGALVDARSLRRDVSQTRLLRDEAFDAVIEAVDRAHDQLVVRLALSLSVSGAHLDAPRWAVECVLQWWKRRKHGRSRLRRRLDEDPVFSAIAKARVWPTVGGEARSTEALIRSKWPVRFATHRFPFAPLDVPFVIEADGELEALLEQLFGSQCSDYTESLEREQERQLKRLEFMSRTHLPELPPARYWARETLLAEIPARQEEGAELPAHTIHGEVGFQLGIGDSWVRLVTQGCLLRELTLDEGLPGLRVVVSSRLSPASTYDRAQPNRDLGRTLMAVLAGVERAVAQLARQPHVVAESVELRALILAYLQRVSERDYERDFLEQFGLGRGRARRAISRSEDLVTRPDWRLGGPRAEVHPLARAPLFRQAQGRPLAVVDLLDEREGERRKVAWLPADMDRIDGALGRPVLLLTRGERLLLRELLGEGALDSFVPQLASLRRRAAFMERSQIEPSLPHVALARVAVPLDAPDMAGVLGLREFDLDAALRGDMPVTVVVQGRELCQLELIMPLPGLMAWVSGSGGHAHSGLLEARDDWAGLERPGGLRGPLLAALVALVGQLVGQARAAPSELHDCEWDFLLMVPSLVLGKSGLQRVFTDLRRERGTEAASAVLQGLLGLLETHPERELERALGRLRKREAELTVELVEAVEAELGEAPRRVSGEARALALLRQGLCPSMAQLVELPSLRAFVGGRGEEERRWSLGQVIDHIATGEALAWVDRSFRLRPQPKLAFAVLSLSEVESRLLEGLFDPRALDEVSGWLEGRVAFERRRTIHALCVPRRSAALVLPIDARLGAPETMRGELGLAVDPEVERTRVRIYTEGREVTTLSLRVEMAPVIGVLEVDGLEVVDDHDDLVHDEYQRLTRLIQGWSATLIDNLALRFDELERGQRGLAAALVRRTLWRWPPASGRYAARAKRERRRFAALAALPVFPGARRPWSADELAEASARGPIPTLDYRSSEALPDGPVIILEREDIRECLQALFGRTVDLTARIARRRRAQSRKERAPSLKLRPPSGALVHEAISGGGLEGWLAIVPGESLVALGEEGRSIEVRGLSQLFPVSGSIWGPGLDIDEDWTCARWSRAQRRSLERRAAKLWATLMERYAALLDSPPMDSPGRRRLTATRGEVRDLFLRLHAEVGRAYARRKKKRKKAANAEQIMYERCRELPVLELSNGRFISADVAARERPIELAELELWRGLSAEELAHERAKEKREAERRRGAAAEAEARREAKRRRELDEARKREAKRKKKARKKAELERGRERDEKKEREERARAAKARAGQALAKGKKGGATGKDKKAEKKAEKKARKKAEPTAEELLLGALREELRLVRGDRAGLISDRHLEALILAVDPGRRDPLFSSAGEGPRINPRHAVFGTVLARYAEDPGSLTLLASSAYTYLNIVYAEIEDEDESEFIRAHAAHAATSKLGDEA